MKELTIHQDQSGWCFVLATGTVGVDPEAGLEKSLKWRIRAEPDPAGAGRIRPDPAGSGRIRLFSEKHKVLVFQEFMYFLKIL